ncbi:MAG: ComF family protein [Alteromonadaceae bacterium]|nr:ComF family protein [Alteromonadaceae bacterium]
MSKIQTGITKYLSDGRFAAKLLPDNICYLCQQPTAALVCGHCEQDCLFFNLPSCDYNLLNWPVIRNALVTASYTQLRAPAYYQWPLDYLVREFKYGQPQLAATLAGWFCRYGLNSNHGLPDCLLPVPTSIWRYILRQYHQTSLLSTGLSRILGIPTINNWAQRSTLGKGWRSHQQGLGRKARLANLKQAYTLTDTPLPEHVAIIDDVITTGSTVATLSKMLHKRYPTMHIEVWTIAVTPLKAHSTLQLPGRQLASQAKC